MMSTSYKKKLIDELEIKIPQELLTNTDTSLSNQDVLTLGFSGDASDWISLDKLKDVSYEYQSSNQYFKLNFPPAWMPTQVLGKDSWYKPEVAQSGIGLLNNYDFIHIDPIKAVQPVVYLLSSVFLSVRGH